jgi:hypothetical protein
MNRITAFVLGLAIFDALVMCMYAVELYSNGNLSTLGWSAFLLASVPLAYVVARWRRAIAIADPALRSPAIDHGRRGVNQAD